MGFFKKLFGEKDIVVDPLDLTLPDTMKTDQPGVTLKKAPGDQPVDIDIVGESFRPKNIAAVAAAAQGKRFDIYLLADMKNTPDPQAVAVVAANVILGYIASPGNKQWFKRVGEAFMRGELLWGTATIASKAGTPNSGVFGHIYMPKVGKGLDEIIPQRLTDKALARAVEKVITLANASNEPDTVAKVRSLSKKAVAVAAPLAAHAKWVQQQSDGADDQWWADVLSVCDSIFSDAITAAYIIDEMAIDVVGPIEELAELVATLRSAAPAAGDPDDVVDDDEVDDVDA